MNVPYNFNPLKYRTQAGAYAGTVSSVSSSLSSAMSNLNNISKPTKLVII